MTAEVERFLQTVVTTPEGWFCLMVGPPVQDEWFKWPEDLLNGKIEARARAMAPTHNVWFCPHLFKEKHSVKENVLPTKTIAADLDFADVTQLSVTPTVLTETSPGRHQGYWVLHDDLPLPELEELSHRITYSIPDCDHSGWFLGHKYRFPFSINHKYATKPPVKIAAQSMQIVSADTLKQHSKEIDYNSPDLQRNDEWINGQHSLDIGPIELFEKFKRQLDAKNILAFTRPGAPTRSEARWGLMLNLFRVGATRDEVFTIAQASANNSYSDNMYGGDRDLAKDVDRAERRVRFEAADIGILVQNILKAPGNKDYKKQVIAKVVIENMEKNGEFVVTSDGRTWYLHRATGRPILVTRHSDYLAALLDVKYGLNATNDVTAYTIAAAIAFAIDRGRPAVPASLSHTLSEDSMLIHGGQAEVIRVTAEGEQEKLPNGTYGVLFPWRVGDEPFSPATRPGLYTNSHSWSDFMFEGFFDNLIGLDAKSAKALMRIYINFIIFKDQATARPLLAVFGQPGSSKSTLLRLIYALLYGSRRSLNVVTNADDFDSLVSSDPFVAIDNVDSWTPWLADKLALSAATSDIVKRKLYTDSDIVVLKRQALVAVSAHNPRFGREDVVDRMLMLNFERLTHFSDETTIIRRVSTNRNAIWGSILDDVSTILREPIPSETDIPQFRVLDFSKIGLRIARALHIEGEFRTALDSVKTQQSQFNLGEEDILITAIRRWHQTRDATKRAEKDLYPASTLFETFSLLDEAFKVQYRNPILFAKKLWVLQDTLKSVFDVAFFFDPAKQARVWRLEPKN